MKKTIIALMALSGVSMGATTTTGADLVTLLQTEIQETSYTLAGDYTYDLSFTMTGNIPYTGGNGKYTLKLTDEYYLVSQDHLYWGLGASDSAVSTDTSTFTFNAENDVYTYTSTSGEKIYTWTRNAENSASGTRSLGSPAAVTVALGYDGSNTTLTLNYGGSDITDKFVLVGTEIDLGNLGINTTPTLSDMSVSITPVSTPAVPEPATATLSLLALAGLAARRRRRG